MKFIGMINLFCVLWAVVGCASEGGVREKGPSTVSGSAKPMNYLVFFDFAKSSLGAEGMAAVKSAAANAIAQGADVVVTGHTDRSGSDAYNTGLAEHRANAVRSALEASGVSPDQVDITWYGESEPLVPTADAVREPQNRRASIEVIPVNVRGLHHRGERVEARKGTYGYVVWPSQPVADTLLRYEEVCRSFLRLQGAESFPGKDASELMMTYWILATNQTPRGLREDCGYLIRCYDYAAAEELASVLDVTGRAGPVLVAQRAALLRPGEKRDEVTSREERLLRLDLSGFSNADISRAFDIWKEWVVKEPKKWGRRFGLVRVREAFRNLNEKYGNIFFAVIRDEAKALVDAFAVADAHASVPTNERRNTDMDTLPRCPEASSGQRRPTSNQAAPGSTAIANHSTANCATSCSTARSSTH